MSISLERDGGGLEETDIRDCRRASRRRMGGGGGRGGRRAGGGGTPRGEADWCRRRRARGGGLVASRRGGRSGARIGTGGEELGLGIGDPKYIYEIGRAHV